MAQANNQRASCVTHKQSTKSKDARKVKRDRREVDYPHSKKERVWLESSRFGRIKEKSIGVKHSLTSPSILVCNEKLHCKIYTLAKGKYPKQVM
jgi:hypothetical protein